MTKLSWVGHSTVKLETCKGLVAMIDPWIKDNPVNPDKELPEKVDLILITHDHFDHTGDTIELSKRTGAKVIAQPETIVKLVNNGLPQENGIKLNIGGTFFADNFQAIMVQAFHTSDTGVAAGYIIKIDGKTIYHLGDTGIFGDLKLFGELYSIDYALIPIGGHFTMDYKHGSIAATMLGAKNVIPIHYKTFPLLLRNADCFVEEVKALNIDMNVIVLEPGETITI
ncbi:metal-dependent hydrolase [Calidifontibacillus oryziterrae]|uniref:metal-dependent hydrolase n=1 Tax=Calidifontibacillus oryziterrae TaxID=1191699 RepID=UPI0002D8A409|nr:metal-dependent hydrolase [Calidifontibacillus oryziterrae]